jgi:hypothetical protein
MMQSHLYRYRKSVRIFPALPVCALLWVSTGIAGNSSSSKPSAPAPAPRPAARPAAPAARPAATGARPAAPAARPAAPTTAHPGTPAARPGSTPARPGTPAARPGAARGTAPVSRSAPAVNRGPATVSRTPSGGTRQQFADKSSIEKDSRGRTTSFSDPSHNLQAKFNPATGRATQISKGPIGNRTTIQRGAFNERRIDTVRSVPGGVERITHYGNFSSVQRPLAGRPGYVQRTVIVGGASYSAVYRSYAFNGLILYRPVPAVVFAPAYYGWLVSPWPRPVIFPPVYWGWAGQPWYGVYGPAFVPYPAYATPDQWLTDSVIAAGLQQSYDNGLAANAGPPPAMPRITDEEKALIDQDIRAELARQQQVAANPVANDVPAPDNLSPPPPAVTASAAPVELPEALKDHLFTVYTAPVELKQVSGESCNLTEGDRLYRTGATPNADNTVDVKVTGSHATPSHPELCPAQTRARVQLNDLQEMYNHKMELLAQAEQKQTELAGKKGMPKGPDPRPTPVQSGKVADPDTAAAVAELKQMMKDADDAERQVATATGGS